MEDDLYLDDLFEIPVADRLAEAISPYVSWLTNWLVDLGGFDRFEFMIMFLAPPILYALIESWRRILAGPCSQRVALVYYIGAWLFALIAVFVLHAGAIYGVEMETRIALHMARNGLILGIPAILVAWLFMQVIHFLAGFAGPRPKCRP